MDRPPDAVTLVRSRIVLAAVFCAAAFSVVAARLFEVMVLGAGLATADLTPLAHPMRADLVDRNGVLIARDLPVSDLYASPAALWDTDEAARELASATGADGVRLSQAFAAKRGYILVARGLTPDAHDRVMSLGLPGLTFENDYKRYYPSGRTVSHAVGQVDSDEKGVSGLELGLDARVRGKEDAAPIELSLDMRIQYVLEREIGEAAQAFRTKAAGGIVLDVHTGEVLALTSSPNYEPNLRTLGPGDSTRNRMTQDVYELGSIFKIFAFAEAIEENTIRLDERLPVGQPLKFGRFYIHDFERLGPMLSTAMIFAESSNIGTAQISMRTGPARQKSFLKKLGLLDPVTSEIPELASPLYPREWHEIQGVTISFGQGISVNPLGFAAAAAAVVNGGTKITPTFLKRDTPQKGERLLSESTSMTMRSLLRLVVTDGTGSKADVPGYDVGGKTGTAEKPDNGRYARNKLISSFCGVFPIDDPQYLVFIMMDEPHGNKSSAGFATGGWSAAPAVGKVIARIAPLLGVRRNDPPPAPAGGFTNVKAVRSP
jgi:cell division protein FtsI (penicillin-binding protein 3)